MYKKVTDCLYNSWWNSIDCKGIIIFYIWEWKIIKRIVICMCMRNFSFTFELLYIGFFSFLSYILVFVLTPKLRLIVWEKLASYFG